MKSLVKMLFFNFISVIYLNQKQQLKPENLNICSLISINKNFFFFTISNNCLHCTIFIESSIYIKLSLLISIHCIQYASIGGYVLYSYRNF